VDPAVCATESIWDGMHLRVPGGGPLKKTPGTRRRTAARIVLGPSRSLRIRTSGRSTSRKRGRVTTPTAAGGSMATRHRRHGLPSSCTRPRALHGSRLPQPRDQSLHSSNKRGYFQYAGSGLVASPPHPKYKTKKTPCRAKTVSVTKRRLLHTRPVLDRSLNRLTN